MTYKTQPEALRLAAQLEDTEGVRLHLLPYAAAELRRLHAEKSATLRWMKQSRSSRSTAFRSATLLPVNSHASGRSTR